MPSFYLAVTTPCQRNERIAIGTVQELANAVYWLPTVRASYRCTYLFHHTTYLDYRQARIHSVTCCSYEG